MVRQSPTEDDIEILVHVAAPSKAVDDVIYRHLAQAYLSFEPVSVTSIQEAQDNVAQTPRSHSPPIDEPAYAPPSLERAFGTESQELSFRSAFDNRASPRLPSPGHVPVTTSRAGDETILSNNSSFVAPASQISDSYPLPDGSLLDVTPSRVLQQYLSTPCTFSGTPTSCASSPHPRHPLASVNQSDFIDVPSSLPIPDREQIQPVSSPRVQQSRRNDVIPVTPNLPPTWTRKRDFAPDEFGESMLDITHISSSFIGGPPDSSPSRAESEPLPPKRTKTTADERKSLLRFERSTSDAGPLLPSSILPAGTPPDTYAAADALEIRPPSPPAASAHVDSSTLVSDKLAKLAHDLSSRYRPSPSSRALDPLERGYWLLDCSRWPPQTRSDTWVFLTNYLRSGLAGWGVWCRRAPAPDHAWIRLYGWACVAKHTYLLLYLASGREVRAGTARWHDAEGEVVIEVPASIRHGSTTRASTEALPY